MDISQQQDSCTSTSRCLKLYQLTVIFMIVVTFLMAVFPEEIQAVGKAGIPLEKIGVTPSKDKVLFVLADGLSDRFTNITGPAVENTVFGRFTLF